jgi:hypothetical protein
MSDPAIDASSGVALLLDAKQKYRVSPESHATEDAEYAAEICRSVIFFAAERSRTSSREHAASAAFPIRESPG